MAISATAAFLSRNRLASILAVLGFAVAECFALAKVLPIVLPPGQVLAIECLGVLGIFRSRQVMGAVWLPVLSLLAIATLVLLAATLYLCGPRGATDQFGMLFIAGFSFIIAAERLRGRAYDLVFSCLASIGCLFVGAIIAWSLLNTAVKYLPLIYDPVLYRIDGVLGFSPLYGLANVLRGNNTLYQFILVLYKYNLAFAIPAVFSETFNTRAPTASLALQLLVSSFLVFPLFCVMPALGPAFYFGTAFPNELPAAVQMAMHAGLAPDTAARNTFPSLHATWAILIFLAMRDSPAWHRVLAGVYLLATFIATIGFGEHYVVDWVGALSVVLATRALCAIPTAAEAWVLALVSASALMLGWIMLIRFVPGGGGRPWEVRGLACLSVLLPLWLETKLARAERVA